MTIRKTLAVLLAVFTISRAAQQSSVTQYGITWTFDQAYETGRFFNGDWWVVGPVTITDISPGVIHAADGDIHNGWEAKLNNNSKQGFDSRAHGFLDTLIPSLPYTANQAQSIVKAVSVDTSEASCRPCLRTAAVLTVVESVPPDSGSSVFRPPYFGLEKTYYNTADIRMDRLPDYAILDSSKDVDWMKSRFERVFLDHRSGWSGASIHPTENMPEYGASVALRTHEGACWLLLGHEPTGKREGAQRYVQTGLDLYHMLINGCTWPSNGGHASGRKLPILMAGYLLNRPDIMDSVSNAPYNTFQEDGHLYFSQKANGGAGQVLFGNAVSEKGYWRLVVTRVGLGNRTTRDYYGYIDGGHRPGTSYQLCCNSQTWKGAALVLKVIPQLETAWNNDHFLTYMDRWVSHGAWAAPDPCAPPDLRDTTASGDFNSDTLNGSHYGITYGPDPNTPGDCIRDTDSSDGIGRFPDLHGTNTDEGGYSSKYNNALYTAYAESVYVTGIIDRPGANLVPKPGSRLPSPVSMEQVRLLGENFLFHTNEGMVLKPGQVSGTGVYLVEDITTGLIQKLIIIK